MLSFKEQLTEDCRKVFHNSGEFAEVKEFIYDGEEYTAPIILDSYIAAEQSAASKHSSLTNKKDNSQGIYEADAVLYINEKDVDFIPRHGARMEIDGDMYYITRENFECGEMVIELKRIDE